MSRSFACCCRHNLYRFKRGREIKKYRILFKGHSKGFDEYLQLRNPKGLHFPLYEICYLRILSSSRKRQHFVTFYYGLKCHYLNVRCKPVHICSIPFTVLSLGQYISVKYLQILRDPTYNFLVISLIFFFIILKFSTFCTFPLEMFFCLYEEGVKICQVNNL